MVDNCAFDAFHYKEIEVAFVLVVDGYGDVVDRGYAHFILDHLDFCPYQTRSLIKTVNRTVGWVVFSCMG